MTRKDRAVQEAVLGALQTLLAHPTGPVRGRPVPVAELRNRLLQMPREELDRALLDLEAEGLVHLEGARGGDVSPRDRHAGVDDARRGLLVSVGLGRGPRRTKERARRGDVVTLRIKVTEAFLEELDQHVSSKAGDPGARKVNRSTAARQLLEKVLEVKPDGAAVERLRSSVLAASVAEARRTGIVPLWGGRGAVRSDELDRAIFALEARGALCHRTG